MMQYVAFIFAIFGFYAYIQMNSLKGRIDELERELTKMKGTSFHEDRTALLEAARSYIGQKVDLDLKEDHMDIDIVSYGNAKSGSNTILDADNDWMLVRIDSPKGTKEKLIRMESVERISLIKS